MIAVNRGGHAENIAAHILSKKGYDICARNFRVRDGEIDIIARKKDELIFVEVKARSSNHFGYPEEGVNYFKKKKIVRAIQRYLLKEHVDPTRFFLRFDIISVDYSLDETNPAVRHIENVELPECF